MNAPYNTTSMSGFVRGDSIQAGRFPKTEVPVVRFQIFAGNRPHPAFVTHIKLAVEMYAWYVTLRKYHVEKVYVAIGACVTSDGSKLAMVANYIEFHTSNPDVRAEVEKCKGDMLSGRSALLWPDRVIKTPLKEEQIAMMSGRGKTS